MADTPQQLVRIGIDRATLTKSQKEFNRLTKRIETLGAELTAFREVADQLQRRVQAEYIPLVRQFQAQQADLVRLFDRAYDHPDFKKEEKKKLADLILNLAYDLIEAGAEDLKPIYDKYDADGFDATSTDTDQLQAELLKSMAGQMFGIDLDDVDAASPEELKAQLQQKLAERDVAERRGKAEERRATQAKSAKQQERDAKKELDEKNITKAVRTLYMDLVKAFHPDREPDEAEKERKTEIMHRVTAAYETGDLLALLRLQLEFERIDQTHLETLADEQLLYYNKILRQQVKELEGELVAMQSQLAAMSGKPTFFTCSPITLELSLTQDIKGLKNEIKSLKKDLKAFADHAILKEWLKTYKIQKAGPGEIYFGDF